MKNRYIFRRVWERYRDTVLPKNVSRVQLIETRRAFYAGAKGVLDALAGEMSYSDEEMPDDIEMVRSVRAEFDEFYRDIARGKA